MHILIIDINKIYDFTILERLWGKERGGVPEPKCSSCIKKKNTQCTTATGACPCAVSSPQSISSALSKG